MHPRLSYDHHKMGMLQVVQYFRSVNSIIRENNFVTSA